MIKRLSDSTVSRTLLAILSWFVLAALAWFVPVLAPVILLLTMVVVAGFTFWRIEIGLALALTEVLAGAHGVFVHYAIGGVNVSLRMALFLGVMIGTMAHCLKKQAYPHVSRETILAFLPLSLAILIGFVSAWMHRIPFGRIFQDGNAYFFLGYLFPLSYVRWTKASTETLKSILAAATLFIGLFSVILFALYAHVSADALSPLYTFLRDIRFAEITHIGFGFYRIFAQTQLFVLLYGLWLVIEVARGTSSMKKNGWMWGLVCITLALGQSRSFLLAFSIMTGIVLFALIIMKERVSWSWKRLALLMPISALAIGIVVIIPLFPFTPVAIDRFFAQFSAVTESRVSVSDAGVSSRWKLLEPMKTAILASPLIGSGFGAEVTYISDDPRVRTQSPDGVWTTMAMEWGWLELWIKMGILGPVAFLWLFGASVFLSKKTKAFFEDETLWLLSAVGFIFTAHFFSPYLNHPLGLTVLLFSWFFLKPNLKPTP